jgi:hypothetical protein
MSSSFFCHFLQFSLPSRLAWFLQELPSLLIPLIAVYQAGPANIPTANMVALAMFVSHYAQRFPHKP